MVRAVHSSKLVYLVCSLVFVLFIDLFALDSIDEILVAVSSVVSALITLIPLMVKKNYDIMEPPSFVVVVVLLSVTSRIHFFLYSGGFTEYVLVGENFDTVMYGAIIVNLSLVAFVSGYLLKIRLPAIKIYKSYIRNWRSSSFHFIVVIFTLVGFISYAVFFDQFIGDIGKIMSSISEFSSKRKVYNSGGGEIPYISMGYVMWGVRLLEVISYLFFVRFLLGRSKKVSFLLFVTYIIPVLVFGIVSSSRNSVIAPLICISIIYHYVYRKIEARHIVNCSVLALVLFVSMTVVRNPTSEVKGLDGLVERVDYKTLADPITGRDMTGYVKTGLIAEEYDKLSDLYIGSTVLSLLVAPVPRSYWQNKPVVRPGQYIGQEVYSVPVTSGVPPGIIGEGYMNFGMIGSVLFLFTMGVVCRSSYVSFSLSNTPFSSILYSIFVVYFLLYAFSFDVNGSVIYTLYRFIPLVVISYVANMRPK